MRSKTNRIIVGFWVCAIVLFGVWGLLLTTLQSGEYSMAGEIVFAPNEAQTEQDIATPSPALDLSPLKPLIDSFPYPDALMPTWLRLPALAGLAVVGEILG